MKRAPSLRFFLLAGLLVLWMPGAGARDCFPSETITVIGESVVYEGNIPQARERALQEAFSTAISQVMGAFITAESYSQNHVSVDRSVLSKTKGYIKTYRIVETRHEGDSLILKVDVAVSMEPVKDDLAALGILLDAVGSPIVKVEARDEGLDVPESEAVFKRYLGEKGFWVDESASDNRPDVVLMLAGSIVSQSGFGGTGMSGAVVSLEGRAVQGSTGKLIASESVAANGAGLSAAAALRDAYRKAAEDLSPRLSGGMSGTWGREVTAGRNVQVILKVNDHDKLQRFIRELGRIFGVKQVDLKSFMDSEARCIVRFAGQTKTLSEMIGRRPSDDLSVTVTGFGPDRLFLIVK